MSSTRNTSRSLDFSTYEVLKQRLQQQTESLENKLQQLDASRKEAFGSFDMSLLESVGLELPEKSRLVDFTILGNLVMAGRFNELRQENSKLEDIFSLYEYKEGGKLELIDLNIIDQSEFKRELFETLTNNAQVRFYRFVRKDHYVYFAFKSPGARNYFKVFKWLYENGEMKYLGVNVKHELNLPEQQELNWKLISKEKLNAGDAPLLEMTDEEVTQLVGNKPEALLHAKLGNLVLIKFKSGYESYKYLIYHNRFKTVDAVESLQEACLILPNDQGVIFPKGFYLQSGDHESYDYPCKNLSYVKHILSKSGQDYLYVFYNDEEHVYILYHYNKVDQEVKASILCHAFSLFEDGKLCLYKKEDDSLKMKYALQLWSSPYVGADFQTQVNKDSFLYKIGNKEVINVITECKGLVKELHKPYDSKDDYKLLMNLTSAVINKFHWIEDERAFKLKDTLEMIKNASKSAIDEFDKVVDLKLNLVEVIGELENKVNDLSAELEAEAPKDIQEFVGYLARFKSLQSEALRIKEHKDLIENMDALERISEALKLKVDELTQGVSEVLEGDSFLDKYEGMLAELEGEIGQSEKAFDIPKLEEKIIDLSDEVELLTELVGDLAVEDKSFIASVLQKLSTIYTKVSKLKTDIDIKKDKLSSKEGKEVFSAEFQLVEQSVAHRLNLSDTPEKCEVNLNKLLIKLDELEARFAHEDSFLDKLSEKREQLRSAFEMKRNSLQENEASKLLKKFETAERVLGVISGRVDSLSSVEEVDAFFTSDPMIYKFEGLVNDLFEGDDYVKGESLMTRFQRIKEDRLRMIRDGEELYVKDGVINLGNYAFSVNPKSFKLSLVPKGDELFFHISGTNFYEKIEDETISEHKKFWGQRFISESDDILRAEYLAYIVFEQLRSHSFSVDDAVLGAEEWSALSEDDQLKSINDFMIQRYQEGYVKGVHDVDALRILNSLIGFCSKAELLRFSSSVRAGARYAWDVWLDKNRRQTLERQINGLSYVVKNFPGNDHFDQVKSELTHEVSSCYLQTELFDQEDIEDATQYLYSELVKMDPSFVVDERASELLEGFLESLKEGSLEEQFRASFQHITNRPFQYRILRAWLGAHAEVNAKELLPFVEEASVLLLTRSSHKENILSVPLSEMLEDFNSVHPLVDEGTYQLDFQDFFRKMSRYFIAGREQFEQFHERKNELMEEFNQFFNIESLSTDVLSTFVRNKLINDVYLPLIGANLAKQIGEHGDEKRTDRMGLLLLISPPGYGKTSLMEYLASRLGLAFVKIDGPSLGRDITSLDPETAHNAGAKEELLKLNTAFEMGDNVMMYIDDIQHCSSEFLQKFISLCDAQRKIEGKFKGKPKTYSFKNSKFCVVMAGNPFTENGKRFKVPEMLLNRADIYNLGDITAQSSKEFELSYLENSLVANKHTKSYASKLGDDFGKMILWAEGKIDGFGLVEKFDPVEVEEMKEMLGKFVRVRNVLMKVNEAYIRSSKGDFDILEEPPFKLQGSYRDMQNIVERINPVMNVSEVDQMISSYYKRESMVLSEHAESSLLKVKEIMGVMTPEEREKWGIIKTKYAEFIESGGDKYHMGHVLSQLGSITEGLDNIAGEIKRFTDPKNEG
ncbi:DNA repair ATPase [Aureibacter tunicatorum]|uniref:ATPase family associated with various cellular activities (AAA) n=1 Tax=Aureibacter tunicatorum TaxID=866807 RepID=A0AAE3XI50_9BACT|nr:DNA repair ATPase [Aureibacter tunicatorum]MDR6238131.1 hypothetical protein [Aureibacter tunicatorum]BDD03164.1 hypothetical protein AUTU_06470 [Aureibacter tunicatorum]